MAINKRISLLTLALLTAVLAAALIAAMTFGLTGKETVASRSAAAFLEAQRKGEPVGESAHGHDALSPGAPAQPAHGDHGDPEMKESEQARQKSSGMAGHDMSGQPMSTSSASADAHAGHAMSAQGDPRTSAGREGQPQEPAEDHAGMQHGGAAAAGTPSDPVADAPVVSLPQPKAAEAAPGQPAGTLRPDPLDQPVETSVIEARRAAEMAREMAGGHGMQHGMTSYRQLDAGRDSVTTGQEEENAAPRSPTSPDHGSMQHGSPPQSAPKAPAARKPPPNKPTPSVPPPEPTHPPHHSGASNASSRHGEATQ